MSIVPHQVENSNLGVFGRLNWLLRNVKDILCHLALDRYLAVLFQRLYLSCGLYSLYHILAYGLYATYMCQFFEMYSANKSEIFHGGPKLSRPIEIRVDRKHMYLFWNLNFEKMKNQSSFTLWGILILIPWNQFWQNRSFRNWKNLYTVDEISFHDKRREFVHSNCFEGLRKRFFFGLTLCRRMKISQIAWKKILFVKNILV